MVTGTEDEKKDENTNRMQLIVSLSFWEAHIFYLNYFVESLHNV